jgi:hypothetical protein
MVGGTAGAGVSVQAARDAATAVTSGRTTMSVRTRRLLAVSVGIAAAALSLAGPASAREKSAGTVVTFSGSVPAPTSGCAVKSFKHDSDTGVGDTGLSSVSVDYSMRPCDSTSASPSR